MSANAEHSDATARVVIEAPHVRHEFAFDKAEVSTVTSTHVVVVLSNDRGERVRAVLPKSMLRSVVSWKVLW